MIYIFHLHWGILYSSSNQSMHSFSINKGLNSSIFIFFHLNTVFRTYIITSRTACTFFTGQISCIRYLLLTNSGNSFPEYFLTLFSFFINNILDLFIVNGFSIIVSYHYLRNTYFQYLSNQTAHPDDCSGSWHRYS